LFPIAGESDEIIKENERRAKLYKLGWLTEDEILEYVGLDSIYTSKIVAALIPKFLNKRELDAMYMSSNNAINMAKMTANGVYTNQKTLKNNMTELDAEMTRLHDAIMDCDEVAKWDGGIKYVTSGLDKDFVEFNYNSGAQLGRLLYDLCQYPGGKRTANKNYQCTAATLEKVNSPMVKLILERKKLAKAKSTYLQGWERENWEGIVRCNFPVSLTMSHRTSSNACNFQNSPKHNPLLKRLTRNFIQAHPGQIFKEYDYSQAEAYCASIISGDMNFLRYQQDESTDMHLDSAITVYKVDLRKPLPVYFDSDGNSIDPPEKLPKQLRQTGKLFNFPILFGASYVSIAETLWEKIQELPEESKKWMDAHFKAVGILTYDDFVLIVKQAEHTFWNVTFPHYGSFRKNIWNEYKDQGFVQTSVGHCLRGVLNSRVISNLPIQGPSALKLLLGIDRAQKEFEKLNLKSKLMGQVHDSLVVSVEPMEEEIVDKIVTTALLTATEKHPLFDWINIDFVLDCDTYESTWASKATEKRMDMKDYDEHWVGFSA
jgi:DNA polymerase I-like protein with 3'-5' exonuclease and polymerase domains